MMPILTVIIASILGIVFWHKKINPDTTWIYAIYVLVVVIISLIAMIIF